MRTLLVVTLALCIAPISLAGSERDTHTGKLATVHFDVKFRPGSRAAAAAERDGAMAERDFADITKKLAFTPEGRFTIYLYDDVPELWLITGQKAVQGLSIGALSAGRETHVAHGMDQTRYHELAHLVTARLPKTGNEKRSMFFPDGLANALLEYVSGVHVHAVAKFHRQRNEVPRLGDLVRGDFYAWQRENPKVGGYDIGGSYFRFLLDTYGAQKVKRYYSGTPAKDTFGVNESKLESAWHTALDAYQLRPEVETLLHQRRGELARFTEFDADPDKRIPKELLGKPKDWKSLVKEKLQPRDDAEWKREGKEIAGTFEGGGWHVCDLGTKKYKSCVVRARIRTENILAGIQLQLGEGCCAMLVGNGTFIYSHNRGTASSPQRTVSPNGEVDLMLVRRGNRMEVWVDGIKRVEGTVDPAPQPVGIGFHCGQGKGTAYFADVRVRVLK
ncbi:MAG: hypothetical protein ACYTDY_03630 [Planctomycetota bacterium]